MRLLLGLDIRVYVRLDNFSFYFADSTKQAFGISVQKGLRTGLVRFELVDNLECVKFVAVLNPGGFLKHL